MKLGAVLVLGLAVSSAFAQTIILSPRVKGAARVKVPLVNPWRPSAKSDRAKKGDFTSWFGSMTVVGFTSKAPKKYGTISPYIYDRIKKKQIPVRKSVTGSWRSYAFWIKSDRITTITVINRSGQKTILTTATSTKAITQKEIDTVIRMGSLARV